MSASKRVIIDKAQPGSQYQVGQSYLMPAIAADAFIAKGHGHVFDDKDWAKQQKAEKAADAKRAKAKAKRKAEQKDEAKAAKDAAPMDEAKAALAAVEDKLAAAVKRQDDASGKKRKQWDETVKSLEAKRADAEKAVKDLEPSDKKPKIEMS